MKKLIILMICLASIAVLSAQLTIFGGIGFNSITDNEIDGKTGVSLGASIQLGSRDIIIEPGLRFVTRGWKVSEQGLTLEGNLAFVEPFVKGKLNLNRGDTKLQPFAGLAIGNVTKSEISIIGISLDTKDLTNNPHINVLFGIDALMQDRFIVGVEYGLGTTDVYKDGVGKFNTFMVNVGYLLSF